MVQMGGWGSLSPFSRMPAISLAGIPSYGLVPNVISSHTVTPRKPKRSQCRTVGWWAVTHIVWLNKKTRMSIGKWAFQQKKKQKTSIKTEIMTNWLCSPEWESAGCIISVGAKDGKTSKGSLSHLREPAPAFAILSGRHDQKPRKKIWKLTPARSKGCVWNDICVSSMWAPELEEQFSQFMPALSIWCDIGDAWCVGVSAQHPK